MSKYINPNDRTNENYSYKFRFFIIAENFIEIFKFKQIVGY